MQASAGAVFLLLAGAVVAALLIGLWLGWRFSRRASNREFDAIAGKIRADGSAETATLRERVRSLEEERQASALEGQALRTQAETLRDALDVARDDKAQLTERSARLPAVEQALAEAGMRLHSVGDSLSAAQARVAALEADNARIEALVQRADRVEADNARLQRLLADLREEGGRLQAEVQGEREAAALLRQDLSLQGTARLAAEGSSASLSAQVVELTTRLESERRQSGEKLELLLQAKEALSNQFKSLASDILEEKSKRFAEQNQTALGQMLDPVKLKLQEFQGKVEQFYDTEGKERSALAQQVTQLMGLNKALSDDARNLTIALKGSSKTQGSWGELILERVLEASGLRKGSEYDVQESFTREDGSRGQPDVIIRLPEQRHLIVDAKVSLLAYEEFTTADDDLLRTGARKRHLDSVRTHIKGLSERNYQALYGLKSLDFVLMFVPIEPAFMLAVAEDNQMYMDAWNKNVLLVSPSTLLFVVRTVAHLWRQEAQNRNAQEIASRGAELYDRLAAFVSDLETVGRNLDLAKVAYDKALAKLTRNRGNVLRQAEMLKELGVKPSKALPQGLLGIEAEAGEDPAE